MTLDRPDIHGFLAAATQRAWNEYVISANLEVGEEEGTAEKETLKVN